MRLASLCLCNFRCFGPAPTTIEFDTITALVGGNGSGKTAILEALARLFGTTQQARTLKADDFHVSAGQRRDSLAERTLFIEARFEFPSLENEVASDPSIPPVFEQMSVAAPDGVVFCRVRLTGTWTKSAVADGMVEARLEWLRSADDEPADDLRRSVSVLDRDRVRVYYVPAARDANRHLTSGASSLLHHALRAARWDDAIRKAVQDAGEELRNAFAEQPAVKRLNAAYEMHWDSLYDEWLYRKPSLQLAARRIEDAIRAAQIVFNPTHGTSDHALDRLSDGQQSLFYFAFLSTLFDIQHESYAAHHQPSAPTGTPTSSGPMASDASLKANGAGASIPVDTPTQPAFSYEDLHPAALTLFAVEEPENHLAPHYLGRIVARLTGLTKNGGAQVVFASHAPSVLARIEPRSIRHLRCDAPLNLSRVSRLSLPAVASEAEKYVREAVRAFPELYFARAAVLCEGDSEEILLPRFARLTGDDLDLALVSVVPLGGRHVNHFWRLLAHLGIPYVTLLDLDRERGTGGWERIHYVVAQLLEYVPASEHEQLLAGPAHVNDPIGRASVGSLRTRNPVDHLLLDVWVQHLRTFGVYFSSPLDIDFMMLEAFEAAYKATAPSQPGSSPSQAIKRVLGDTANGASYTEKQVALFPWYSYLFLGRGKPSTHTAAWVNTTEKDARAHMPEPIAALLKDLQARQARPPETNVRPGTTAISLNLTHVPAPTSVVKEKTADPLLAVRGDAERTDRSKTGLTE